MTVPPTSPPIRKLPEKKYFKIGEVADLVGVEPHVLRYWETQFPQLRPHKARSGHRLYRRREVETLLVIRELLHVQRFTIAGARQALRQPGGASSLIPRFFGDAGSSPFDGNDSAPPTLVPQDASVTDPDGRAEDEVEVEAVGVDDEDELREVLERETAAIAARGRTLVEVEVGAESVAPMKLTPVRAHSPGSSLRSSPLGAHAKNRGLLESALGDARAILAILDREDAHRRMHA